MKQVVSLRPLTEQLEAEDAPLAAVVRRLPSNSEVTWRRVMNVRLAGNRHETLCVVGVACSVTTGGITAWGVRRAPVASSHSRAWFPSPMIAIRAPPRSGRELDENAKRFVIDKSDAWSSTKAKSERQKDEVDWGY